MIAVTIPLLLVLSYIVQQTRQGKAMRATAQDQDAARLMGINVDRTISFTFALGGAMAGAAGLLYLETFGTTRFDAGFQLGLIAFTAAVLGGIGNLQGAVLGGVLIGLIQGFNDGLPYGLGQKWSQTVVFTDPHPAHGLQTRRHPGQADHREGVTRWLSARLSSCRGTGRKSDLVASHTRKLGAVVRRHRGVRVGLLHVRPAEAGRQRCRPFVREWMPLGSVNEALVWVICAIGLNIVVGYAGLLDLGFVAFWAIGGYTAGWLMSTFFNADRERRLLPRRPRRRTSRASTSTGGWSSSSRDASAPSRASSSARPTLRLKSDYLALVTLGFGEIIPQIFLNGENIAASTSQRRQGHRTARPVARRAVRSSDRHHRRHGAGRSPSRSARSTSPPSTSCS